MKVSATRVSDFIDTLPSHVRGVLLYGPNEGLAKEYQEAIIHSVTSGSHTPFTIIKMFGEEMKDGVGRIALEASQHSLIDGRRVIVVTGATDKLQAVAKMFLGIDTDVFLLLQAGDLKASSSLRKCFEGERGFAALPCYQDTQRTIASIVVGAMRKANIKIAQETIDFVVAHVGCDRLATRSEIEKLIIYAGDTRALTLSDVQSCIYDVSLHAIDDIVYATATGNFPALDKALKMSFAQGVHCMTILRTLSAHFVRLHKAKIDVLAGETVENVAKGIFFKHQSSFIMQVQIWSANHLVRTMKILQEAERVCKKTATPVNTVISRTVYRIASLYKKMDSI